jgi:DNA-binding CsgD family transcriptional regulator
VGDRPALGTDRSPREVQLFHAWLAGGTASRAAELLGVSESNVQLGLHRLEARLGVRHAPQLVRPLVITPLYIRLRRLEVENRQLRSMLTEVLGTYTPDSSRLADGGIGSRRYRRRWRKARRDAIARGFIR